VTLDLSVIIVSWNVWPLLDACLRSLEQRAPDDAPAEVIVIDNGSHDGTPERVRQHHPGVCLLEAPENPGFAAANARAAARARGQALFFLNPDTEVLPGALHTLDQALRQDPTVGAAGPLLLESDGQVQSSRRRFPTRFTLAMEATALQPVLPARWFSRYYCADLPPDRPQRPDWLQGAALLVRRTTWEEVGPFDAGFFMYFEETDWFRRAAQRGWRALFVPQARVVHHGGRSSTQRSEASQRAFLASKVRYAQRHLGPSEARALTLWLRLLLGGQLASEAAKWVLGHKRPLRRARLAHLSRLIAERWNHSPVAG
jgi:N-acetylglucosaminyl-diphospho-decaprenol L-rhamnosyltransferase